VEIGERRQANVLVLRPVGRIDNLTSGEFQARLLAATTSGPDDIVVDFTAVEYISSAGLRTLMAARDQKAKGTAAAVACLNSIVSGIFAISRFSHGAGLRHRRGSRHCPAGAAATPGSGSAS
jgi:anti-anti-sigma factor